MIRGNHLDERVYDPEHIQLVLSEIERNFGNYFATFATSEPEALFAAAIESHEKELESYQQYLDLRYLDEYEEATNAFKAHTQSKCPIIRRCLQSRDERMKGYKRSFRAISGRELLNTVKRIALFGSYYHYQFDESRHENVATFAELKLAQLNEPEYGCAGVIGYGIQSALLYGRYPACFAYRSQTAVWALYFLTDRKDFGIVDDSEFLISDLRAGTCEQNYFYPADLFGYYSVKLYCLLRDACQDIDIHFNRQHRYAYLSAFSNHVANIHRNDINILSRSSDSVESYWRA